MGYTNLARINLGRFYCKTWCFRPSSSTGAAHVHFSGLSRTRALSVFSSAPCYAQVRRSSCTAGGVMWKDSWSRIPSSTSSSAGHILLRGEMSTKYLAFMNSQKPRLISTSSTYQKRQKRDTDLLPFEVDTNNITQDLLVYSNEGQSRFFFLVTLFGIVQFGFWAYLAHFAYTALRDTPVEEKTAEDKDTLPFWRRINLGGNKYRFGTALLCVTVGYVLLFVSIFYPMRAVKYLHLLKGGIKAKVTTYGPLGVARSFTARVDHIQSLQSRAENTSHISMKVKDRYMFYLLDNNGKYHNTQLFDFIAGLKRQW